MAPLALFLFTFQRKMAKLDGVGLGYSYHLPSGGWALKIRSVLSQFSDLFSEFDKYIAPAYHHDRCERLARGHAHSTFSYFLYLKIGLYEVVLDAQTGICHGVHCIFRLFRSRTLYRSGR